jgi:hypothetical protein
MIPYIVVNTVNPVNFYNEFEISDENFEAMIDMVESGFENEALDLILEEYLVPAALKYDNVMRSYLSQADAGPMRIKDHDALLRNISLLTLGLTAYLNSNFSKFSGQAYVNNALAKADIVDSALSKTLRNEVNSEFEKVIGSTFSQTQNALLGSIRTLQREMISENLLLKNSGITGEALNNEIMRFKESLKIKYPQLYRTINQGNLIEISRFDGEIQKLRHYKIDYYIDLTVRTSLLNADRNANLIAATIDGDAVMEYLLIDDRKVVKDREICQHILDTKTNGLAVLALTQEYATKLGIMTVDEARNTPDFAMGIYCRHGLKRCSKEYLEGLKSGN